VLAIGRRLIEWEIEQALSEDGAGALVLGRAGMTDLTRNLPLKAGVPVLDGVACASASPKVWSGWAWGGIRTPRR
jgi:Asp/Glu/hydantoin racemase